MIITFSMSCIALWFAAKLCGLFVTCFLIVTHQIQAFESVWTKLPGSHVSSTGSCQFDFPNWDEHKVILHCRLSSNWPVVSARMASQSFKVMLPCRGLFLSSKSPLSLYQASPLARCWSPLSSPPVALHAWLLFHHLLHTGGCHSHSLIITVTCTIWYMLDVTGGQPQHLSRSWQRKSKHSASGLQQSWKIISFFSKSYHPRKKSTYGLLHPTASLMFETITTPQV